MEDPIREIPTIIHGLATLSPSHQTHILDKYFLPTASFHHPLCYVPSFSLWKSGIQARPWIESRTIIKGIYRWYKMMAPTIEMSIQSVALDKDPRRGNEKFATLYVDCTQAMYFWFLPGWYRKAEVGLVVVLSLEQHEMVEGRQVGEQELEEIWVGVEPPDGGEIRKGTFMGEVGYAGEKLTQRDRGEVEGHRQKKMRWFISKQRDLYPPEDLAQFALFMPGTTLFVYCFQIMSSLFCLVAAQVGKSFGFFPDEAEDLCSECEDIARHTDSPSISDTIKTTEGGASYMSSRYASRLSGRII